MATNVEKNVIKKDPQIDENKISAVVLALSQSMEGERKKIKQYCLHYELD